METKGESEYTLNNFEIAETTCEKTHYVYNYYEK